MAAAAPQLGQAVGSFDLRIQCRNLPNLDTLSLTDAYVIVSQQDPVTGQWHKLGQTEVVDNSLNVDFVKPVRVAYMFEVVQTLLFRVLDDDGPRGAELIGEATCVLTDIVLSEPRVFTAALTLPPGAAKRGKAGPRGSIVVAAEDVSGRRTTLRLQFSALALDKKDLLGKSDGFLVLHRVHANGALTAVAKTEVVKNSLNPTWRELTTTSSALYGNSDDALVEIQCFDWNKHAPPDFIGSVRMPAAELLKPGSWQLINAKKAQKKGAKYKNSGLLRLTNVVATETADFLDYLNAGLHITAIVGIDCTASNGTPSYATSLHYLSPYQPNQYQRAIMSVGSVIEPYSTQRAFIAYGYGGQAPFHTVVNHCFAFNMNENAPMIPGGTAGLLNSYGISMPQIKLSGPTLFAPIILQTIAYATAARQRGQLEYFVLLLLTDGVYQDRQATIDAIVAASTLPISIIICGVGTADFSGMTELDADDKALVSSRGVRAARDIVQFVPFLAYEQQPPGALAAEVLRELPDQVVQYMASIGYVPPPKPKVVPVAAPAPAAFAPAVAMQQAPPPSYDHAAESSSLPPYASSSAPPAHEADLAAAAATIQLDDASSDDSDNGHANPQFKTAPTYPDLHL